MVVILWPPREVRGPVLCVRGIDFYLFLRFFYWIVVLFRQCPIYSQTCLSDHIPFTVHFILMKPVLSDHLSYVTLFHKIGLTVFVVHFIWYSQGQKIGKPNNLKVFWSK